MNQLVRVSVTAACPTCGRVADRLATVPVPPRPRRLEDDPAVLPDGIHRALLTECERCWEARAWALRATRASLTARGHLGRAPSGLPTWDGAELRNDREPGADALGVAVASELLRRGRRSGARTGTVLVRVQVVSGRAAVVLPAKVRAPTA